MRHYGAPTRLVDWTRSFFVAAYFAIENADVDIRKDKKEDYYPVIWAIRERDLLNTAEEKLKIGSGSDKPADRPKIFFKKFLSENSHSTPLAYPVNPLRLSRRLSVQQGLFMCPTDVQRPFEDNFIESIKQGNKELYMLIINPIVRKEALYDLYRMNITRASLFPGLQGFAESLNTQIFHKWILHTQHSLKVEDPLERIEERLKALDKRVAEIERGSGGKH